MSHRMLSVISVTSNLQMSIIIWRIIKHDSEKTSLMIHWYRVAKIKHARTSLCRPSYPWSQRALAASVLPTGELVWVQASRDRQTDRQADTRPLPVRILLRHKFDNWWARANSRKGPKSWKGCMADRGVVRNTMNFGNLLENQQETTNLSSRIDMHTNTRDGCAHHNPATLTFDLLTSGIDVCRGPAMCI